MRHTIASQFIYHDLPWLSEYIFDIAVTEIEAIVEPDGVRGDARWESIARTTNAVVQALALAKEAGVDTDKAMALVNCSEN